MNQFKVTNEDGTSLESCPKNTLLEKWYKLYPKPQSCIDWEKTGMQNYSCEFYWKCPEGVEFKIPKEDLEEYRKYSEKFNEYIKLHNPSIAKVLELKQDKNNN